MESRRKGEESELWRTTAAARGENVEGLTVKDECDGGELVMFGACKYQITLACLSGWAPVRGWRKQRRWDGALSIRLTWLLWLLLQKGGRRGMVRSWVLGLDLGVVKCWDLGKLGMVCRRGSPKLAQAFGRGHPSQCK